MPKRDVIVVGASTGGPQALQTLVAGLPADFPAAVFVVQHTSPQHQSLLPLLLSKAGPLPANHAVDGEPIHPGRIYVAPPDRHLVLEPTHLRVTRGPKENRVRPAVDPLFRSAAYAFGPRAVGVVLTGALDDGTAGLWAIKDRGGVAIVQDPDEAEMPSMPQSAMHYVEVDYCLKLAEIGPILARLVRETAQEGGSSVPDQLRIETQVALQDPPLQSGILHLGPPSLFTCPECHGILMELQSGDLVRFRCHTGHSFTLASLLAELSESTEDALWNALRAVQEKELVLSHMARHARDELQLELAQSLTQQSQAAQRQADLVRQAVLAHETTPLSLTQAGIADAATSGGKEPD